MKIDDIKEPDKTFSRTKMGRRDYRFENKATQILLVTTCIGAFIILLSPLYSIYVIPSGSGSASEDESSYTLHCYVFRSYISNTDCELRTGWNACFKSLNDINTGVCDNDKLVIGSENLEEYSAIIDILIVVLFVFLGLGLAAELMVTAPSAKKNDFLKVAALFHFLSTIIAVIIMDNTFSIVDETEFTYQNGIGQKPVAQPALYTIIILPLLSLLIDNFHVELL